MNDRRRKGHQVVFRLEDGARPPRENDPVAGLRFSIAAQTGGKVLIDFTGLKQRRLALAFARALRHMAAPGGALGVRSTVKAYSVVLPRFFDYLRETAESVASPADLKGLHVDGFEAWLEARGLSRVHLFTVLSKVIAILRQIAADESAEVSPDLVSRLRYTSAKPFQRPRPRDAYSPFVARQLRDAARKDVAAVIRRLKEDQPVDLDPSLRRLEAAVHAIIMERGLVRSNEPAFKYLYQARRRLGRSNEQLGDELNGQHHLTRDDVIPFLVLLGLETGLEIECCKALTIDCLRNATGGSAEIAYLKRRARGAEHKRLRVRDGGSTAPADMIRQLIDLTAAARRHCPSQNLWVYYSAGVLTAGVRYPQMLIDSWTRRHGIVDDDGRPLRLLLSHLRKTHKALWYLKTEGHMTRFAVGHTPEVAARHYADVPALRPLHETTVAEAFREVVAAAVAPTVLDPDQEAAWRRDSAQAPNVPAGIDPITLLDGEQDVWLASCAGFHASPYGPGRGALPAAVLGLPRMFERGDHRPEAPGHPVVPRLRRGSTSSAAR
jgi:hypothetical protein